MLSEEQLQHTQRREGSVLTAIEMAKKHAPEILKELDEAVRNFNTDMDAKEKDEYEKNLDYLQLELNRYLGALRYNKRAVSEQKEHYRRLESLSKHKRA